MIGDLIVQSIVVLILVQFGLTLLLVPYLVWLAFSYAVLGFATLHDSMGKVPFLARHSVINGVLQTSVVLGSLFFAGIVTLAIINP